MNMTDMAYTRAEIKDEKAETGPVSPEVPKYPWGLQVRLEREELDKLGITDLPDVGDVLQLMVSARVTGVTETQMANAQDTECCVTLQIEEMAVHDMAEEPGEEAPGPSKFPPQRKYAQPPAAAPAPAFPKRATLAAKYSLNPT